MWIMYQLKHFQIARKDLYKLERWIPVNSLQTQERADKAKEKIQQEMAKWDPSSDPNATSDPFKTLIIARMVYSC